MSALLQALALLQPGIASRCPETGRSTDGPSPESGMPKDPKLVSGDPADVRLVADDVESRD